MKRLLILTLILSLLLPLTSFADTGDILVKLDGNYLTFDQPPVMQNDRVLVPLRTIFEALNATVDWDDATQTVTSTKGSITVTMQIDNPQYTINGEELTMDVPPLLLNSRTLIPVRAVAESFGCQVDWDDASQTVIINSEIQVYITSRHLADCVIEYSTSGTYGIYSADYPEILNNDNQIRYDTINNDIRNEINVLLQEFHDQFMAYSDHNLALAIQADVVNKSNNLLSVLYTSTLYSELEEISVKRNSAVYKLTTGEKATLTDYFPNKTEEEIIGMLITDFNMIILQEPEYYYEDAAERVEIYIDDLVIYPCGKEVAVSFNPGVIAPYEMGFITLTYPAEY